MNQPVTNMIFPIGKDALPIGQPLIKVHHGEALLDRGGSCEKAVGVHFKIKCGGTLLAPAEGVIYQADYDHGVGRSVITIGHGGGVYSIVEGVGRFRCSVGQHVTRSEVIGYAPFVEGTDTVALTWKVRIDGMARGGFVDPLTCLSPAGTRLVAPGTAQGSTMYGSRLALVREMTTSLEPTAEFGIYQRLYDLMVGWGRGE